MNISIIIPVYNEQGRLETVLTKLTNFYEVIIIDDGSEVLVNSYIDFTKYQNIKIFRNITNLGYIPSIKRGISQAKGDIIVTMDGDGEHKPDDIVKLVEPIEKNKCDIVFGKRPNIARPSEILLLKTARIFTGEKVEDSGTGFRAIRSSFAKELEFIGKCTCGLLLIESHAKMMRICEIEVDLPIINKSRRIAWEHFAQFFILIGYVIKLKLKINKR